VASLFEYAALLTGQFVVVRYLEETDENDPPLWHILHDDTDEEDLEFHELQQAISLIETVNHWCDPVSANSHTECSCCIEDSGQSKSVTAYTELIGRRLRVWWPEDGEYYVGTLTSFCDKTRLCLISYDDGDVERLNLENDEQIYEFLPPEGVPGTNTPSDIFSPAESHCKSFVGQKVIRTFEGGDIVGRITGYVHEVDKEGTRTCFWKCVHDDGDEEELQFVQLRDALKKYCTTSKTGSPILCHPKTGTNKTLRMLAAMHSRSRRKNVTDENRRGVSEGNLVDELVAELLGHNDYEISRLLAGSPHETVRKHALPISCLLKSAKMEYLCSLIPKLLDKEHKILIFSQFTSQLDLLETALQEYFKVGYCRLDGSTASILRQHMMDEFNSLNNHSKQVFLLSTRAGGQGINLASASVVISHDPDPNPQNDAQAEDRCHRIGQTKQVLVYRLIAEGTVEEHLHKIADKKRHLEEEFNHLDSWDGQDERTMSISEMAIENGNTTKSKVTKKSILGLKLKDKGVLQASASICTHLSRGALSVVNSNQVELAFEQQDLSSPFEELYRSFLSTAEMISGSSSSNS